MFVLIENSNFNYFNKNDTYLKNLKKRKLKLIIFDKIN